MYIEEVVLCLLLSNYLIVSEAQSSVMGMFSGTICNNLRRSVQKTLVIVFNLNLASA